MVVRRALRARIIAGDTAIKELEETKLKRDVWQRDAATKQELWRKAAEDRAAAIKRVAELTTALEGDHKIEKNGVLLQTYMEHLAAARAEIERLKAAIGRIATREISRGSVCSFAYEILAPKEN